MTLPLRPDSALEACAAVMARCLPAIDACIIRCSQALSGSTEYDDKIASHVAWLAAQMARVSSELRQVEKHLRTPSQTEAQRRALVLTYVRLLDPEKRAEVAQLLEAPPHEAPAGSSLERCTASLARSLPAIDACLERVVAMLDEGDEYNLKMASHLVWVLNHLATISSELRQTQKHDRAMTKNPAQRHELVLDYLHVAPAEFRGDVARALAEIEQSASILGGLA